MKSFRWTLVAVAAVGALAVFTLFDYKRSETSQEKSEKDKSLLKFNASDINRIEIINRMGSIVVEKTAEKTAEKTTKDAQWTLSSPVKDKADIQAVESFLQAIDSEKTLSTVVEGENLQLETFGLKQPITQLKVQTTDGKLETIKIGSVKAFDGNLYAQVDDEKRVSLVTQSWDPLLAKSPSDLRDKHLLRKEFKTEDLTRIEFKSPDFSLSKSETHWKLSKGGVDFPLADDKVTQFIDELKGVRALEVHKKEPLKASYSIALYGGQNGAVDGKAGKLFESTFGPEKKAERGAATVLAQSSDYQDELTLTSSVIDKIRRTPQDFYDKKLPFQFAATEIQRIEVETPSIKAAFVKKGNTWEPVDPGLQKQVDSSKLDELLKKLGGLEAVRVLEGSKSPPKLKDQSRIRLLKTASEPIFEFAWGAVAIEKASSARPEARYHVAWTNKAHATLGVSEGEVKGLGLESLINKEPKATPPVSKK